jgi:hypothetical protein
VDTHAVSNVLGLELHNDLVDLILLEIFLVKVNSIFRAIDLSILSIQHNLADLTFVINEAPFRLEILDFFVAEVDSNLALKGFSTRE